MFTDDYGIHRGIKKNNTIALSKEEAGDESHFFC